jgi:hypothetical protein
MAQHPKERLLDMHIEVVELDALRLDATVGKPAGAIVIPAR